MDRIGVEAQTGYHDDSSDQNVTHVNEVNLVLNDGTDTGSSDHAVQNEGDTADNSSGDGVDDCLKLGRQGEDDSHDSSNTHYEGVEYAGQGYYAGVLGVGGVGRAAEQTGQGGTDTVAQQGAGQTGISDVVLAGTRNNKKKNDKIINKSKKDK